MALSALKSKAKLLPRLMLEFLIIFTGVYAAYLLEDHRDQQRQRLTQAKYCATLIHEFQVLDSLLAAQQEQLESQYLPILQGIERGERPTLLLQPLFFDYRGLTLESAFAQNNFDALSKTLLANIAGGYTLILAIRTRTEHFQQRLANLSALQQDASSWYQADGTLRPEYLWYPSLLTEMQGYNQALREAMKVAIPDLKRRQAELQG